MLFRSKQSACCRPDEITYNTLIHGYARFGNYEQGMALLAEMQELGVRVSNYTLSVVAKLAIRSRRPERAFELCEELSKQFGIRLNVQVYNNLVHACTVNQDMQRGLKLLEQMQRDGIRPDSRTFTLLLRGSLASGEVKETAALLRAAFGLLVAMQLYPCLGTAQIHAQAGITSSCAQTSSQRSWRVLPHNDATLNWRFSFSGTCEQYLGCASTLSYTCALRHQRHHQQQAQNRCRPGENCIK